MLNTHGIKMIGIRKAAGETKSLRGYYSGEYVELHYDRSAGKVLTTYQYSLGQNTWAQYRDSSIIKVCNISEPCTMQEIADMIFRRIRELDALEVLYA